MTESPKFPHSHIDIIESEILALVSTIRERDGHISTNPVSYEWDGEYLRFSTLKNRVKYKNLLANPQVTFCVVSSTDPTRYVEVRGKAEITDDPGGAFQLAMWKRHTGEDEFKFDPPGSERVTVTIIPEQISAPTLYGGQLSSYTS